MAIRPEDFLPSREEDGDPELSPSVRRAIGWASFDIASKILPEIERINTAIAPLYETRPETIREIVRRHESHRALPSKVWGFIKYIVAIVIYKIFEHIKF